MRIKKSDGGKYSGRFGGGDYGRAGGGSSAVPGTSYISNAAVPKPTDPPVPPVTANKTMAINRSGSHTQKLGLGANAPFGTASYNTKQPPNAFKPIQNMFGGTNKMAENPLAASAAAAGRAAAGIKNLPPVKHVTPAWNLGIGRHQSPYAPPPSVAAPNPYASSIKNTVATNTANAPPVDNLTQADSQEQVPQGQEGQPALPAGAIPYEHPQDSTMGKNIALATGTRIAANKAFAKPLQAISTAAPTAARAGKVLSYAKGGLVADSLMNIGTSLLDYGGIYDTNTGQRPLAIWNKPKLDVNGQPLLDENGAPQWEYGYNPDKLKGHNEATTPSDNSPQNYLGSSWAAYQRPIHSAHAMGDIILNKSNPLIHDNISDWKNTFSGNTIDTSDKSLPLQMLNKATNLDSSPSVHFDKGTNLYNSETETLKRLDKYHPIYNREGSIGRPNMIGRLWDRAWN